MSDSKQGSSGNRPQMEDLSGLPLRKWEASAVARVVMKAETLVSIVSGQITGGDVLSVASIGGVLGAKNSSSVIPVRHPQTITHARVEFGIDSLRSAIDVTAYVKSVGASAITTEALSAAFAAALTICEMCREYDNEIAIEYVRLGNVTSGETFAHSEQTVSVRDTSVPEPVSLPRLRVIGTGETTARVAKLKPKRKRKAKPKAKRKAGSKPKAKARAKAKPKARAKAKPKAKSKPKSKAKPKAKARAKAKAKPKAKTRAKSKTRTKAKPKAKPKPKAKAKAKSPAKVRRKTKRSTKR